MIPLFIVRFLPRSLIYCCSDKARNQLVQLENDVLEAERLLEEMIPGNEYTEGFRLHLQRKLDEWNQERFFLVYYISKVEDILFPPSK